MIRTNMLNKKFLILGFLLLFSLASIQAEEFGYNYLKGDLDITSAINYTTKNVNNSIYWNGNAWSDTRWLNIDGSNANQNIGIGSYNLATTGTGFFGWLGSSISRITKGWFTDINISDNLIVGGNVLISGYYSGQPIDGSIGSGIIEADEFLGCGCINVTDNGVDEVTYTSHEHRIVNTDGTTTYCYLPSDTVTITDQGFTVYYVDSSCVVQSATFTNYYDFSIHPGDYSRIFDVYKSKGAIEESKGASLIELTNRKYRKLSINCQGGGHLTICDGMNIQENTFPYLNQTSGHYVHINSEVTTTQSNTETDGIHFVYRTAGDWTHDDGTGINLTHCDDGTDLVECSTPQLYRRYYFGSIGWTDTKIHQLASFEDETFTNIGNCLDTTAYPLGDYYTIPSTDEGALVIHSVYCGRGIDSDWSGSWISIGDRATAGGIPDLSPYMTYTDWNKNANANNYDLININYFQASNGNFTGNLTVDTDTFFVDSSNNRVGFGTTYPSEKLDIAGNININEGSAYLYNGSTALKLAKGTDIFYANTFVGVNAGNSTAQRQTSMGYFAGYLNTGISQTAVGYSVGYQNTGDYQSAIGYFAGYQNTGISQIAIGYSAGRENTGVRQSSIGHSAGYQNTGDYQSAIGYYAGRLNTGDNQIAIGHSAGYENTGISQTAIGYFAGRENIGTRQTAIGHSAGYQNTGGAQTAMGYYAGYQNTGVRVSGFGYETTMNNSGNDVVALGYQAGKGNAVSNQFIVKQANINAVPLIQGDFSSGNVGIGVSDALSILHINGSTGDLSTGLSFGDGDTGIYESSDDVLNVLLGGVEGMKITANGTAFGSNTIAGLSNGDINVSTVYYDVLTAKSPVIQCSDDWCSVVFPKHQKTLWINKNQDWTINEIIYENQSYTKQEFWNTICQTNSKTQDICLKLNNKVTKLENRHNCISNGYEWNGSCYETIKDDVTYEEAIIITPVYNTTQSSYTCTQLNSELIPEETICYDTINTEEIIKYDYSFKDNCGWNNSYYCNKKIEVLI